MNVMFKGDCCIETAVCKTSLVAAANADNSLLFITEIETPPVQFSLYHPDTQHFLADSLFQPIILFFLQISLKHYDNQFAYQMGDAPEKEQDTGTAHQCAHVDVYKRQAQPRSRTP